MDSGVSVHASSSMESMVNFKSHGFDKVHLADGEALKGSGNGDVNLKFFSGATWTLKDVCYIPGLKRRLVLVGQLSEVYHVDLGNGRWKVVQGSLAVARGKKKGSLYMVVESCSRGAIDENDKKSFVSSGSFPKSEGVKVGFCKEMQKRAIFAEAVWKPKASKRVAHGGVCMSTSLARVCVVKHKWKEKVVLEDITGSDIPRSSGSTECGEASTSRRSSRTPRVPHMFSPSAIYPQSMVEEELRRDSKTKYMEEDSGQWESGDSGQWESVAMGAKMLRLGGVSTCLRD